MTEGHFPSLLSSFTPLIQNALELALALASQCPSSHGKAYNVGCVIVDETDGLVLSTGYSREADAVHAEEIALAKLLNNTNHHHHRLVLVTTMEPCSLRLSGQEPCINRILQSPLSFSKIIVGCREPKKFNPNCVGLDMLRQGPISVIDLSDSDYGQKCLELALL